MTDLKKRDTLITEKNNAQKLVEKKDSDNTSEITAKTENEKRIGKFHEERHSIPSHPTVKEESLNMSSRRSSKDFERTMATTKANKHKTSINIKSGTGVPVGRSRM